jgi:hypothetical protein
MSIEREQSIVACARGILLDAVAAENREAGWKFRVANWQQAVSEHIELWQRSTTTTKGNIESNQAVEVKREYCLPGHAYHGKSKGRRLLASLYIPMQCAGESRGPEPGIFEMSFMGATSVSDVGKNWSRELGRGHSSSVSALTSLDSTP